MRAAPADARLIANHDDVLARAEDVPVDMLPPLRRCDFDAVQLGADQNPPTARRTHGFMLATARATSPLAWR